MALDIGGGRELSRKAMKGEVLGAEKELQLAYAWEKKRGEKTVHIINNAYMRVGNFLAF